MKWYYFILLGNSTLCEVTISGVETSDHGDWTCAISDNLSLDTVKQVVSVGVSVPGDLSLSPGLPVVTLAEGDTAQFVCRYKDIKIVGHLWKFTGPLEFCGVKNLTIDCFVVLHSLFTLLLCLCPSSMQIFVNWLISTYLALTPKGWSWTLFKKYF